MRLASFLLGGVVGIAAAAYISQRRPDSLAWAGNAANGLVTGIKGRWIEKAMSRELADKPGTSRGRGRTDNASDDKDWGGAIEQLIENDPEAKRQAEQILSESKNAH